ncbi:MAG: pyruvate kinase [Bauldia sp.]|nr:pyruvate kinase [Bauldia sp.]MCW5717786.1 pyruvate kinase [Bauldia sp.]
MKRARKVKILATLGPASREKGVIKDLAAAGADVFRINMSHTPHAELRRLTGLIREVEHDVGHPIGVLVDLQGPKFRLATFADKKVEIKVGQSFTLDSDPTPGDETRVHLPHPEILKAMAPGDRLLLDDGRVQLVAKDCNADRVVTKVVAGTALSDKKGVSVPDTMLPLTTMTRKDRADLEVALEVEADWIAMSFVQQASDMTEIRSIVAGRSAIIAKIEKPQAIQHLQEIIDVSDALMVARGDLGVEVPLEQVPGLQKRITRAARRAGKPVVVATQMLESMITAPVPTRAEVSDVATAVFEGADAVMLSAESAAGAFPVEAVATMDRIAREVETDANYPNIINAQRAEPQATGADAIAAAVRSIAETLKLAAICCYTGSGTTAIRVSRERPQTPIIALSPVVRTARRLALGWGLHCLFGEEAADFDGMVDRACEQAFKAGFARAGDRIIITAGVPMGRPGTTNMLRIAVVNDTGTGAA